MISRRSLLAAGLAAAAPGAAAEPYRAPRTPLGVPDLQGVWSNSSLTPLERPPVFKTVEISEAEAAAFEARGVPILPQLDPELIKYMGAEVTVGEGSFGSPGGGRFTLARLNGRARTAVIVSPADGRLPYTAEGRRQAMAARNRAWNDFDNPEARQTDERCLLGTLMSSGPPMLAGTRQIVQTADRVVFLSETNHDARIVRLDAKGHLPPGMHPWMGDSIGRWEGDTLVVETTNFHPAESLRPGGIALLYMSPHAKVTERFTRTAADRILYQFDVEDPAVFTEVWRGELPMRPVRGRLFEYACHEGNYSLANILAGARATERNQK